jgi:hypothetical protein
MRAALSPDSAIVESAWPGVSSGCGSIEYDLPGVTQIQTKATIRLTLVPEPARRTDLPSLVASLHAQTAEACLMAVVLAEFVDPVAYGGVAYRAQACGAQMGHLWEGWIEFIPIDDGPAVRSSRETTQPNLTDAEYWATGLTHVYLEGALNRAMNPTVRVAAAQPATVFDGPAADAVLNPFSVYEKGESLLRQELSALSAWHLVNIVRAYALSGEPLGTLNAFSAPALIDVIVAGVRRDTVTR